MKFQPCLSTCHPPHPSFAWRTPDFFVKKRRARQFEMRLGARQIK